MKFYQYILPALASTALLTGCDDQIMEWGTPDGHGAVTTADIPLAVKEVLANYGNLKDYAQQYQPQMTIGLGIGAALYANTEDPTAFNLANDNFQMITLGNAMKHDGVVTNGGSLNFATMDQFLDAKTSDMALYGHNFLWHTQQQSGYLKSLIAPTLVVESSSDIQTLLAGDAANFDGGTTGGWGSWGSNKDDVSVVDGAGQDGSPAAVLKNKGDGNNWEAQFAYTFDTPLDPNTEYTIRFKAKSTSTAGIIQFQYQNGTTYGSQGAYNEFTIGTDWTTCEFSFTPAYDDANRIILNFGKVGGTYTIDDIEFGTKVVDPMDNVLAGDASDFEGGTTGGWGSWGSNKKDVTVVEGAGYKDSYGLVLENNGDGNNWEAQNAYTFDVPLQEGKKYIIQFYAKSTSPAGIIQFQYQNGTTYGSQGAYNEFTIGTDWTLCEYTFAPAYDDVDRIILNFGKVGAIYYVDNIKFGLAKDQGDAEGAKAKMVRIKGKNGKRRAAAKSYYVMKTPEEKREILLTHMEAWIKGMAEHLAEKGVTPLGYDVVNEPITDGNGCKVRGVDGVFGGSEADDDGNVTYDEEPTETAEEGLELNWANHHFYWGYYVPDYAVKAFEYARQYLPAETKLFVNDYNLENSDAKRTSLINFAKSIDEAHGSPIVDGLGTQMHVSLSATDDAESNATKIAELKTKIDAQFRDLAATGKLVRVTELDIALGTASPSATQYQAQSDCYKMIVESYMANVPAAQQSGITFWSLSDNEAEHEYWLKDQSPNLFDASYLRKWAYKGACDALAGQDLGLQFGGNDYKAYYEKNNVSPTVGK